MLRHKHTCLTLAISFAATNTLFSMAADIAVPSEEAEVTMNERRKTQTPWQSALREEQYTSHRLPFFASLLAGDDPITDDQALSQEPVASCLVEPYAPAELNMEFLPYDPAKAIIYRYRQQQSVNLGSWFVQEQWMNPSLFSCSTGARQSELDVASGWGSLDNAKQVMERHWDTWIVETDFAYLAGLGINTVRLPIGYWSLGPDHCINTPFEHVSSVYTNSWPRVIRAINWAEKYGLGILIDFHGAPGSQNGQAHSGVSSGKEDLFGNAENTRLTINALCFLTRQLVYAHNVVGIQILNEPNNVDSLPVFYSQALDALRSVSAEAATFPFYIHDAFDLQRFASYIGTRSDFVVVDHHSYFVFGDSTSQKLPVTQLCTDLQSGSGAVYQSLSTASTVARGNVVVDEFSLALSDGAINGSKDIQSDRKRFGASQLIAYSNATAGWSFWSYKTENCDDDPNWCFKSAVGRTLPSSFSSDLGGTTSQITEALDDSALNQQSFALPLSSPVHPKGHGHYPPSGHGRLGNRQNAPVEPYARVKGYRDGYEAGAMFSLVNRSRLGFIEQFITDALRALEQDLSQSDAVEYRAGFRKGVADLEMGLSGKA